MSKIRFVGLDVHADTIAMAVAEPDGEVRFLGVIPNLSFANNRSGYKLLCCNAFITVVESAELWNGNDLSVAQRLSRKRTLFIEAQMGSRTMVVAEVTRQRSFEMARIQNHVVVQTFPSNGSD